MKTLAFALGLGLWAAATSHGAPGSSPGAASMEIRTSSQPAEWTVIFAGKPLMVYAADPQTYKAYVKALHTLEGDNVLRDAPHDHLHHHALMYGIAVNGLNFWEEISGSGVQKVIETQPPEVVTGASGRPAVRLVQLLHWVSPQDAFLPNSNSPALLIERRTLTVAVDEARKETALVWNSHFEVGPKTNVVTLTGSTYFGLGMRFQKELDPVAKHFTASGPVNLANNRQDTEVYPWEAIAFKTPGRGATIALAGAHANARGKPRFFAMATPFAYLAATQGLDRQPLVYEAGQSFDLTYLVVVYPQIKTTEELAARFREFEASGR